MPSRPADLIVVGPTASGKTELAVALALELGAEIVSADSRQVYRGFDAATAKPPKDAPVRHHLVDAADPRRRFDAATFAALAGAAVADIRSRGRRVVACGGTGLYVRALREGLSALPPRQPEARRRLEAELATAGPKPLHARLAAVDPAAAAAIPAGNRQRLVRALEVYEATGRPISASWGRRSPGPLSGALVLAVDWPPAALAERIERRARAVWPGLLAEVRRLRAEGLTGEEPAFESLGYREALACADGRLSEEDGLAALTRSTLAYAKRQRTWFRHQVPGAARLPGGPPAELLAAARRALEESR